jgi:hypothetical protein
MLAIRTALKLIFCIFALSTAALADHIAAPNGTVILTITGALDQTNIQNGAELDLDMLRKMGSVTISTSTPWTEGVQDFEGVPLNTLLAHIAASPSSLTVTAINEYQVVIPASDAVEGGPILAWAQNGKQLSIREKGPLWLIYPFDAKPEYQKDEIHARAVWQVVQIDLLP